MKRMIRLLVWSGLVMGALVGCLVFATKPAWSVTPEKLPTKYLPNLLKVHPGVFSGGTPRGTAGFEALAARGIRTVVSVDSAPPDVELAKRFGLRYVHLPHGYDGIPSDRVMDLAKAVRDLNGPIYLHCQHGQHRSPAAAGVACVSAGLITASDAKSALQVAGTDPNYRGLFKAVEEARPMDSVSLDQWQAEFPQTAPVAPLAEAMVNLEHELNLFKQSMTEDPRNTVVSGEDERLHRAVLLREHFAEMLRTDEVKSYDSDFQKRLLKSQETAQQIEEQLTLANADVNETVLKSIVQKTRLLSDDCKACHVRYRDNAT